MLRLMGEHASLRAEQLEVHSDETGRVETRTIAVQVERETKDVPKSNQVDAASPEQPAGPARTVDLPKVVHLLRLAANNAVLIPQDPLVTALRPQVESLIVLESQGGEQYLRVLGPPAARSRCAGHGPHAEVVTRDVRAALEVLTQ